MALSNRLRSWLRGNLGGDYLGKFASMVRESGSSPIETASLTLTHADILDEDGATGTSGPFELIPAPGAGKIIQCGAYVGQPDMTLSFDWFADYVMNPDFPVAKLELYFGNVGSIGGSHPSYLGLSDLLTWGNSTMFTLSPADIEVASVGRILNVPAAVNQPLLVKIVRPPTDGGDPRNTVTISTTYRKITVPT